MFGPAAQQRPAPDSAWLLGAAFLLLFLFLDWVSYIRPVHGLNITPWNPASPLAIALLMWNRRWLWIVWLALVASELIVRGLPTSWFVTLAATAALSFAYAAIAQALERRLDRLRPLTTRSDLLWFTAVAVVGALICSVAYVGTFSMAGLGPGGPVHQAMVRYWIGDAVGMLVVLPLLFVLLDPVRRAALLATLRARPTWLAAAVIGALTGIVFGWGSHNQVKYFYLLLLPVVWLSATRGVPGAVLAIGLTQFGLIVAVHLVPSPDLTVFELQALMAVLTMTGLLLGVAADERSRAEAELRGTLHLAAAGQIAAALAHELSQPLTALSNYADACEVIAGQLRALDAKRSARLVDVSRRIVDDSRRAGDIVKRLRDFFRTGATQLRSMSPSTTLHEAIDAQLRRAQALRVGIALDVSASSLAAVDYVLAHRAFFGPRAEFTLLHSLEVPSGTMSLAAGARAEVVDLWLEAVRATAREQVIEPTLARFAQAGLEATVRWLNGKPGAQIARFADEASLDLLVMGSHGRGVVAGALLGSVATSVAAACTTPLLLIREAVAAPLPRASSRRPAASAASSETSPAGIGRAW